MQGIVDSFGHTTFTFAETGTHDSHTTIFEDGFHICKVKVHCSAHGDNLGNTFGSDRQCIICLAESIHERKVGIYLTQAFVIDNQ